MAELQAWIKKRGSVKSRITTFKNFLSQTVESNPNADQALSDEVWDQLEQRISRIKGVFSEFENIQATIE
ncbi:hypothetical protein CAJAP_06188 [Camponotus japonicus]